MTSVCLTAGYLKELLTRVLVHNMYQILWNDRPPVSDQSIRFWVWIYDGFFHFFNMERRHFQALMGLLRKLRMNVRKIVGSGRPSDKEDSVRFRD